MIANRDRLIEQARLIKGEHPDITNAKIAAIIGVSKNTIGHWLNEEIAKRHLERNREWSQNNPAKKKKIARRHFKTGKPTAIFKDRYRSDPDFRNKINAQNRKNRLIRKFGSVEAYETVLESQDRRCLICLREFDSNPHYDHCHQTGQFRGLLCPACNKGLGIFGDDPERLRAAAAYIEKAKRILS